jgi:hypothetical protein
VVVAPDGWFLVGAQIKDKGKGLPTIQRIQIYLSKEE